MTLKIMKNLLIVAFQKIFNFNLYKTKEQHFIKTTFKKEKNLFRKVNNINM